MFKTCPSPIDVQDIQYKLHCRLKVFDNKQLDTFPKSYSLITCASRYGLLFVGSNFSNFQVIQLKCIENYSIKDKDISNYPRRNINLPSSPQHISVNCDSTILAVVTERDNCANVTFYDVLSFYKQDISIIKEARLSSTPGVYVKEIGWNPALPPIFTACKSDGTLGVYEIKGPSININELPAASEATCFCWSPKGKQIAVGSKNSRITQYKPDLKAVKVVNQPPLEGAHSLISLQWVSNYQFIGIYQSLESGGSAKLIVVDAPKTGDPVYTNYEDVCYSGTSRLPQFYMILQPHWNILMVASSNSTELGILGSTGETWTQWIISDSARAELPLSTDHQETLPVGVGLDISSTRPLPWNESTIPPCPYLLILSHHGVLCIFDIVNLKQGVPSICAPPDAIPDLSGIQQFVTSSGNTNPPQKVELKIPVPSATAFQNAPAIQAPVFGAKILTQPQPMYSAPETLFGSKSADSKPLFGSPTTLTPIKPQQSAAPTLFGGQTLITPVAKQQTTAAPVVAPAEKYSAIFSALNAPALVPSPAENKAAVVSVLNIPKPAAAVEQPTMVQPKAGLVPVKEVEPSKVAVSLKMKEETDVLLAQMVKDDSISLESELKALLHQGKLLNVNIGSEEEKIELIKKIGYLQDFIKEIVDISIGENAEVHYLKQNLIQSWAWYEEARSRYNASKDETVSLLLRSQPLDSATEKKQTDIRKMMFYIESQITQASKALDEQWDNFQDYAKKVHRTKMPTMEAIFQAMVRQNGILQRQTYILKDIASRLRGRGHSTNIPSLLLSLENPKDLEESLNRLKIEHPQDIYQVQYERVLNRMKNLSETKTSKLRSLLRNRIVLHVTAVKPQLSASLMLQSPESKSKRLLSNLSALASTPVPATTPPPKALSFVHSTPIRESKTDLAPVTQTDGKAFTFKKIEVSNLASPLPTANSFIPLSKSASVFGNLPQEGVTPTPIATYTPSAFVPTQVNFGGGGKLNFASPATTTATSAAKTVAVSAATSTLPKFGASKTPVTTAATSSAKSALSQFSFGSGLSITPVSTAKMGVPAAATTSGASFGTAAVMKPSFSFGGTTNIFGAKGPAATDSAQTVAATAGGTIFSSKPFSVAATSSSSTAFGIPNTSKFSAFSAVANASNLPVSVATVGATSKPEELSVTKPPVFPNANTSGSGTTVSTAPSVVASAKAAPVAEATAASSTAPLPTAVTTTAAISVPSARADAPSSTATTVAPTTTVTSFGTATSVSTGSSGTSVFTVTTATFTKPTSATTPIATSTQNLFFGGTVTPNTSVFSSNTSSTTSQPSIFGATSQSSIFAKPQQSFFGPATSPPQTQLPIPPSAATSSIFGAAASTTTSGVDTTAQSVPTLDAGKTPSIFGSKVASTQSPFFGGSQSAADVTSTSTQPSFFGGSQSATGVTSTSTQPSFFRGSQSAATVTTSSTQPSFFGASVTSSSTQPSFFGGNQSTASVTTSSTQPSFFGGTQSTASVTDGSTQPSIFGAQNSTSAITTTTQSGSIFGSAVVPTQSSIFGGTQSPAGGLNTTAQAPQIFGSSSTAKTTASSSLFLSSPTTTTPSPLFGISSTSSAPQPSAFGGTSPSNQSSPFGTNPATNTQQNAMFGGGASASSTSIFASTPGAAQTSIFGGAKSASTTKSSIFGGSETSTTQNSIFGASSAPSTQTSIFGTASTTASPFTSTFGSSSPFGQASTAFGAPKTTASSFGAGFGSPTGFSTAPATTSSIFGQPAAFGNTSTPAFGTPTTATNIFGSSTSTFGASTSANVFGSPATSSPSSFSFAGAANNAGNAGSFGFGGLSVDSSATTNNAFGNATPFGQAAVANPFNRTTEQKSPFGGGGSSVFGNQTSSSGSIFGSNTGSNTQGGFGSSNFGSPSAFGQQPAFGQGSFGSTSFGSTQPGPFSGGSGAVAQTGFGSPTSFAKPSGFGSPAVFGGSPPAAFGAAPSFGGAPSFGAAPAFGSPNKVFGSNTPTGAFGSASTASSGFGNLANQNTVGFGNLAQQASAPNSTAFTGSSSFSSWR